MLCGTTLRLLAVLLALVCAESRRPATLHPDRLRRIHRVQWLKRLRRQSEVTFVGGPRPGETVFGERDAARDSGPWGFWQSVSPCSRSCGGGVSLYKRECSAGNSPDGSSPCSGPTHRYESCNIEACPVGSRDFREEQCSQFDNIAFEGRYYSWIPYRKTSNQCELNCKPVGERFYYRQRRRVVDGTSCGEDDLSICVNGECRSVGCDRRLGSVVQEDQCRVCGGDGSTCHTASGTFETEPLQQGYNDILLIPEGATNIMIEEVKASGNYLALRNLTGHFYLNGNWRIDTPSSRTFAGCRFHYERQRGGFFGPERVRALGPTTEALYLVLLYQERNPGIRYRYSVPTTVAESGADRYRWNPHQWSSCSAHCGKGTRQRTLSCVRVGTADQADEEVSHDLCDVLQKPEVSEPCNEQACEASWVVGNWSACSADCGSGGVQVRPVTCGQRLSAGVTVTVGDEQCARGTERPADTRACEAPPCASFYTGQWSPCDKLCGDGERHRPVICHRVTSQTTEVLPDSACTQQRPNATEPCWHRPCEGVDWVTGAWSGCAQACGLTTETRLVLCASKEGSVFNDSFCHQRRKPETARECSEASQCEYAWYASQWSDCSAGCGSGVQTRRVFCGFLQNESGAISPVEDELCEPERRYSDSQSCTGQQQPPCSADWHTSPWGPCSASCEGGSQTREVFCSDGSGRVALDKCDADTIPFTYQPCNDITCADAELLKQLEVATQSYVPGVADDDCLDYDYADDDASGSGSGDSDENPPREDPLSFTDLLNRALDSLAEQREGSAEGSGEGSGGSTESSGELGSITEASEVVEGSAGEDTESNGVSISSNPQEGGENPSNRTPESTTEPPVLDLYEDAGLGSFADLFSDVAGNISSPDSELADDYAYDGDYGNYDDFRRRRRRQAPANVSELDPNSDSLNNTSEIRGDQSPPVNPARDGSEGSAELTPFNELSSEVGDDYGGLFSDSSDDVDFEDLFPGAAEPRVSSRRKCKRRPVLLLCGPSTFGCCPDGLTPAAGPFHKDCPEVTTCQKTRFGCCPDRVTPATDEAQSECPTVADCQASLFGCCHDNFTAQLDSEGTNCPPQAPACQTSRYGCCEDGETSSSGPFGEDCPGVKPTPTPTSTTTAAPVNCTDTEYGCCADGVSAAAGADQLGCPPACASSQFGCCSGTELPAHGADQAGCCVSSAFGCCPDNVTPALGDDLEGCGCEFAAYGCCPDNATLARGPQQEGCGCQYTTHGCCPDGYTPAAGEQLLGCRCHTFTHGCCDDGETPAQGPSQEGCGCDESEFGCCEDGRTHAEGPELAGCGCESSRHGCCPDGVSPAQGDDFQGCQQRPTNLAELCGLPKQRGPCRNFTVRWFFDTEYGSCARFWYGGCQGNGNSFDDDEQCKATCVEPEGRKVCQLPMVRGPCEGDYPAWYYDQSSARCERFSYGGCLGNANRFETEEACQERCVETDILDPCQQEVRPGPCAGQFHRWFFDTVSGQCTRFRYGGCKANLNNFLTEEACKHRCSSRSRQEVCSLPRAGGDCDQALPRWYFDFGQSRCMPFYYSGCGANLNQFTTQLQCQTACPERLYAAEACADPMEVGSCSNYTTRYWYNLQEGACVPFQYSGCGGNRNRFSTDVQCRQRCLENREEVDALNFQSEWCSLPAEEGSCTERQLRWRYDPARGRCDQFVYSGCGGNPNRFQTEDHCLQRCGDTQDVCSLPRVVGPCSGSLRQFYFDSRLSRCLEFDFSGCQGNGNRFNTLAECQFRCSSEVTTPDDGLVEWTTTTPAPVPEDVCQLRHDPGPCREPTRAWFFRASEGLCRQFTYGGCGGNANKFVSPEQCERSCGQFKAQDACNTAPSAGGCSSNMVRWFFDRTAGRCRAFTYTGCGGNANRFGTEAECQSLCVEGRELRVPDSTAPDEDETTPPSTTTSESPLPEISTVLPTTSSAPVSESFSDRALTTDLPVTTTTTTEEPDDENCTRSKQHCREIVCPMGVERTFDTRLCERCTCYQPCQQVECGPRERCVISHSRDEDDGLVITAACRLGDKPGVCPAPELGATCSAEDRHNCRDDADCTNNRKCCTDGCYLRCLVPDGEEEGPVREVTTTETQTTSTVSPPSANTDQSRAMTTTTTPPPANTTPDPRARIVDFSDEEEAPEGSLVELKCGTEGNPQPIVTWKRRGQKVDVSRGRYRQLRSGSLQIVGVLPDDAGQYTCEADNYRAAPDRRTTTLTVLAPTPVSARVLRTGLEEQPVAELGGPALLRCHTYGWPTPSVTWWRGRSMLPRSSSQYQQGNGQGLLIKVVRVPDLGVYTCQAYNGRGQAVAWSTQLRAWGPVDSPPPHLWPYLRFVVSRVLPAGRADGVAPTVASTEDTKQDDGEDFPVRRPGDRVYQPEYAKPDPPTGTVPVSASITMLKSTFAVGEEIRVPCKTTGRPAPSVTWYKDDIAITADDRLRLSADALLVMSARPSDSGQYRCRVGNSFSTAESSVHVSVEGLYIPPSCVDNPFFANCRLIVAARYCNNQYYARFCCRSCTQDGQLSPDGPHLRGGAYFSAAAAAAAGETSPARGRVLAPGPQVVGSRRRLPRRRRLRRLRVRFGAPRRSSAAAAPEAQGDARQSAAPTPAEP